MLLRRITQHVKDQNWFAVLIDFAIVVVGVFIGIQVSNWNDVRAAKARETVYLELLQDDVTAIKTAIVTPAAAIAERRDAMIRTLRALETCDESRATVTDIRRTFVEYPETVIPGAVDATYREMLASGAFAAMENGPLKQSIADLYAEIEKVRSAGSNVRLSLPLVDEVVWQYVSLTTTDSGRVDLSGYDFDEFCGKRDLVNAVVEMIDMQSDWKNYAVDPIVQAVESFERSLPRSDPSELDLDEETR